MAFDNWFAQGVVVNIVTAAIPAISMALWRFWNRRRATRKLNAPQISPAKNKGVALSTLYDIFCMIFYGGMFVLLPEATGRWSILLLLFVSLAFATCVLTLLWKFFAWQESRKMPPAT